MIKSQLRLGFDQRPRYYEYRALTFNKSQTLAANETEKRC